jgi:hypothetical protein
LKDQKIKLSTLERLSLSTILPEKDNIDRLLLRKGIIEKVEITPDEAKEIELKQVGSSLTWNDKAKDKEVELLEVEMNYLNNCLDELSNKKEFPYSMLNIYQKLKSIKN